MQKLNFSFLLLALFMFTKNAYSQSGKFAVIAYYSGGPEQIDSFAIEKLTHVIFSFSHLKGNKLHINNGRDSATIKKLVALRAEILILKYFFL
jgi:chitinase